MGEWVLVMTLVFASDTPGVIRDMSTSTVDGFTSKARCEVGGRKLAETLIRLGGQARGQAGIVRESYVAIPQIRTECVQVER